MLYDNDDTERPGRSDAVGDVRLHRSNYVRELRERNAAELAALKAEMEVRHDLSALDRETPGERWRRRQTEKQGQHEREHARDERLVRRSALMSNATEIATAIVADALAEHREYIREILIGIIAHWNDEQNAVREEVRALRIELASLKGDRDEARRAADDLRYRTHVNERRH